MLQNTKSKILQNILENNGSIFAIKLPNFVGLLKRELCPGRTLGRELADFVGSFGIRGIIHSDEDLMKYQVVDDFRKLREVLKTEELDAVVLIGEFKEMGKVADLLIEKINKTLLGPEKETRTANQDGTTRYTRPLPGAARLYPESDEPSFSVSKELVEKTKKQLPEPWTNKLARFKRKLKLSEELAKQILKSDYLDLFEKIAKMKKVDASIVANTFTNIIKDLEKREGAKVENLADRHFIDLFDNIVKKRIVKEAIADILKYLASKPEENASDAINSLNLKAMKLDELKSIVKEVVAVPNLTYDKAVGLVMARVRGRIEAQIVMKIVKRMFKGK